MSGEPIWFIVARGPGGDSPSVIVGNLPARLTRKIPKDADGNPAELSPLIYSLRLDKLPPEQRRRWIDENGLPVISVSSMYRTYCRLRDRQELPQITS